MYKIALLHDSEEFERIDFKKSTDIPQHICDELSGKLFRKKHYVR